MAKRKSAKPKPAREMTADESLRAGGIGPDVQRPETTVEWQVTPADTVTTYVFTSPGKVFSFLASEWARFVLSWDQSKTVKMGVEVRRVERERIETVSQGHHDKEKP